MRQIYKTSFVIWLLNGFDKTPINGAKIFCNDKQCRCIKKSSGGYVFVNMDSGKYKFDVVCDGFGGKSYDVEVNQDETNQIKDLLYYNKSFKGFHNLKKIVFSFKDKNKILSNEKVRIVVDDKIPSLRVVQDVSNKDSMIKINSEYNRLLIFQEFMCGDENIFWIDGYDNETKKFVLRENIPCDLKIGDVLKPTWDLATDELGQVVLPINKIFMRTDNIKFFIYMKDKKISSEVDLNENKNILMEV